jgi:predicted DNA-binding antitoxin AbrB/MazE fold protein
MTRSIAVVYDGEVFRPVEPVDLPPNTRGRVTIRDQAEEQPFTAPPRSVQQILARARALDLPTDLAAQHDHYLYGTPKR